jgi:hypothetical protein
MRESHDRSTKRQVQRWFVAPAKRGANSIRPVMTRFASLPFKTTHALVDPRGRPLRPTPGTRAGADRCPMAACRCRRRRNRGLASAAWDWFGDHPYSLAYPHRRRWSGDTFRGTRICASVHRCIMPVRSGFGCVSCQLSAACAGVACWPWAKLNPAPLRVPFSTRRTLQRRVLALKAGIPKPELTTRP